MSSPVWTTTIMNQLVLDLATGLVVKGYADMEANRTVYLSPLKHWPKSAAPLEIQVIRGVENFLDQDGFIRAQAIYRIFALNKKHLDANEKHFKALAAIATSIYKLRDDIITILHGKYIGATELLVRPLLLNGVGAVETSPIDNDNDTLGLTIDFTGGTNNAV